MLLADRHYYGTIRQEDFDAAKDAFINSSHYDYNGAVTKVLSKPLTMVEAEAMFHKLSEFRDFQPRIAYAFPLISEDNESVETKAGKMRIDFTQESDQKGFWFAPKAINEIFARKIATQAQENGWRVAEQFCVAYKPENMENYSLREMRLARPEKEKWTLCFADGVRREFDSLDAVRQYVRELPIPEIHSNQVQYRIHHTAGSDQAGVDIMFMAPDVAHFDYRLRLAPSDVEIQHDAWAFFIKEL